MRGGVPARVWGRVRRDLWDRPEQNFDALDGMRGFASVIIVLYHCALFIGLLVSESVARDRLGGLRHLLSGFWIGIDIFFVLSGFLIGRILISSLTEHGRIFYGAFVIRRSFRIFPAYYLILALSTFVLTRVDFGPFWFVFGSPDRDVVLAGAWSNFVYLNNYFYPGNVPGVFAHGWSLCVEEHFYAILPPLLWVFFRGPRWLPLAGLLACVALPFLGRAAQYLVDPDLQLLDGFYYYSHNRFDEIFVGVVIAYLYVCRPQALRVFAERCGGWLPLAGIACVAAVWSFGGLTETGAFPVVWQFLVLAIGSGILLINGLHLDNVVSRFFAHRAWYPLARISYGTYLVHPFVLWGLLSVYDLAGGRIHEITAMPLLVIYCATMLISSLLAAPMFILLERPLLDIGARHARASRQAVNARSAA